jgi:hypothetical protein
MGCYLRKVPRQEQMGDLIVKGPCLFPKRFYSPSHFLFLSNSALLYVPHFHTLKTCSRALWLELNLCRTLKIILGPMY